MTGVTKMSVPPAEPLGNRTAEATFERDELFSVLLTVSDLYGTARRAY
jgi:hypothetical protein